MESNNATNSSLSPRSSLYVEDNDSDTSSNDLSFQNISNKSTKKNGQNNNNASKNSNESNSSGKFAYDLAGFIKVFTFDYLNLISLCC